jgi:Protein of unknown function (DUF4019)
MMEKLTTLDLSPVPADGSAPGPPKRVLWKWSFAATAAILLFLMWQCGSAFYEGRGLSNASVREFHQRLNGGRYEEIYEKADEGLAGSGKHDELVKFLQAVHTKLGNAAVENLVNMRVNATTGGTFIVARYNTTFERGSAVETFTWIKSRSALKLYGYDIRANASVVN